MAESDPGKGAPQYDRDYLLSPGKRNDMMTLWEVEKFGTDSVGDADLLGRHDTTGGMRRHEYAIG